MKHPARIAALAVALVVIVFGVVLALNVGSDPQEDAQQSHLVGKAAPAFDLPNLAGGRVTLADVAGKSAIVNFWNSWCTPCREEEPSLQRFYAAHKDDPDFAMIGIVRQRRDGRREGLREEERDRVEGRARSRLGRCARLRHPRAAGDVRDLARAEWSRRRSTDAMSSKELELFLAAARQTA